MLRCKSFANYILGGIKDRKYHNRLATTPILHSYEELESSPNRRRSDIFPGQSQVHEGLLVVEVDRISSSGMPSRRHALCVTIVAG